MITASNPETWIGSLLIKSLMLYYSDAIWEYSQFSHHISYPRSVARITHRFSHRDTMYEYIYINILSNVNGESHLIIGLNQNLVIFRESHQKHYTSNILKAMYPFAAFWSLATNINHSKDNYVYIIASFKAHLNMMESKSNGYSIIPVVGTLTRRISCSVGKKFGVAIRSRLSR